MKQLKQEWAVSIKQNPKSPLSIIKMSLLFAIVMCMSNYNLVFEELTFVSYVNTIGCYLCDNIRLDLFRVACLVI